MTLLAKNDTNYMPYCPKYFQLILLYNKYNLFILSTNAFDYKPCFVAPLFTTPLCFGMQMKRETSRSSRGKRALQGRGQTFSP